MDEDSLLAAQQRVSKSAIDGMLKARKERDALQSEVTSMRSVIEAAQEISAQIEIHGRFFYHTRQKLADALAAHAEKK